MEWFQQGDEQVEVSAADMYGDVRRKQQSSTRVSEESNEGRHSGHARVFYGGTRHIRRRRIKAMHCELQSANVSYLHLRLTSERSTEGNVTGLRME